MRIAFVIYPGITALDFVGFYDPMTRLQTLGLLPDVRWEVCSLDAKVADGNGLELIPTQVGGTLEGFDVVFFPGGFTRLVQIQIDRPEFIDWVRTAAPATWICSVCTGALILGAAGFLQGRRVTTHQVARDQMRGYGAEFVAERVVEDAGVITAGGVTSSIDLGLYLCRKLAGPEAVQTIRERMEYRGLEASEASESL